VGESKSLTGGTKLMKRLAEISKQVSKPGTLRVGFLEGGTYPDGTSVPMVAAIQEFGAPRARIPPRPFMRTTVAKHEGEWGDQLAAQLVGTDYDVEKALGLMGDLIRQEIVDSIIAVSAPPLSEVTRMLRMMKSQDQSLVVTGKTVGEAAARVAAGERATGINEGILKETGHLMNTVDYEVKA
jgi:hypothetical protein